MRTNRELQTSFQRVFFFLSFVLTVQMGNSQVTAGHVDDFQNLTLNGWMEGGASPNPPTVVATGGPTGTDDAFLQNVSSGTTTAGGKWIMFNQSSNWTGNYLTAGVAQISMDVRNAGNNPVHMRISFNGSGGGISSDAFFTIDANSQWTHISFSMDPLHFVTLSTGGNATTTLSNVGEFRIVSNMEPNLNGEAIAATVDVDNIRAEGVSRVRDLLDHAGMHVFPNPASTVLNIAGIEPLHQVEATIFTLDGRLIQSKTLDAATLDVSTIDDGLYLLQIGDYSAIPFVVRR